MNHFWTDPRRDPIIVAHRGASRSAPENTMAAFRKAVAVGAEAIEFDVRLSGDGEVVVFHDRRLGRTADGRGAVADRTSRELRRLSAGQWFHERFAHEKIPLLAEVLDEFGSSVGLNIELKADRFTRSTALPDRVLAILRNAGLNTKILCTSFQHLLIRHIRRSVPELSTGLLLLPHRAMTVRPASLKRSSRVDYIVVGGGAVRKSLVERSRGAGLFTGEYTVNTERRYSRARRFGVNAVITDDPSFLLSLSQK